MSEVSIACVPVCMVVVTPPELRNRSGGGRKVKGDKTEEKLEGDFAVKKLTKMSRVASKRRPAIVQRTKQTTCSRRHRFSRKVLLRHKHWHW